MTETFETIIIGAGQAGLATAYHLAARDRSFVVLESHDRVGDNWRERFDSLRLYSPARYDALPGWPMPLDPWTYPTKDEMADYLEAYAERFELPVITGAPVDSLRKDGDRYVVRSGAHRFEADNVVVASGTFQEPIVPAFAGELDPGITQLHSADYRNPSQLQDGPVLVVGCSHSGADIALEVAAGHATTLSGRFHAEVPFDIEGPVARRVLPVLWFLANQVLTMRTPLGRKMRPEVRAHGGPLLRVKRAHLAAAGVDRTDARVAGVQDGKPVLDDGRVLDVANVVWCTGVRQGRLVDRAPRHRRGRLAGADARCRRGVPRPVLRRPALPVRVRVDARRRRRARRRARGRAHRPAAPRNRRGAAGARSGARRLRRALSASRAARPRPGPARARRPRAGPRSRRPGSSRG
jgi:putative flavoprotein involved in K+ transport